MLRGRLKGASRTIEDMGPGVRRLKQGSFGDCGQIVLPGGAMGLVKIVRLGSDYGPRHEATKGT
eukprot:1498721-Pyramimonas_sp.AAC.1